jgi:hypothetical protein
MDPNLPYKSMLGSMYDATQVHEELYDQRHPAAMFQSNSYGFNGNSGAYDGHVAVDQKALAARSFGYARQGHAGGRAPGHNPVLPSQYIPGPFPQYNRGMMPGGVYAQPQYYGEEGRIVGEYREPPRLVAERAIEQQPIQQPVVTVEKTVEIPTVIVKEHLVQQPKVELVERVIEMPRITYEEHIKEVPQKQYVERVVEVPQTQVEEKVVHVPVVVYQERIIEVPKVEYVEKIEYEDYVEYREVLIDTYVEVPEIEYRYNQVEVKVPEPYFQEVPQYRYTEVPMVQVQEVERVEQVPVPVEVAPPAPPPQPIPVQPMPVRQMPVQQVQMQPMPTMPVQPMPMRQMPMQQMPMQQMPMQSMAAMQMSAGPANLHLSATPWHRPGHPLQMPGQGAPTPPVPA